tara:strand:+ start:6672 stop:6911 length:240 start_codon:yes stop_codon:yes gene_type:complete
MSVNVGFNFYEALVAHYEGEKAEALAVLKLYLTNPVGVADHSNVLQEMKAWNKKLAEAEDGLAMLEKHFVVQDNKQVLK